MSPNSQLSFWTRMGLRDDDQTTCISAICDQYPGCRIQENREQGYCSFTLVVSRIEPTSCSACESKHEDALDKCHIGDQHTPGLCIVQIRPEQHSIELDITRAARKIYGSFAPEIEKLDCNLPPPLEAFEMELIPGVPLSRLQPRSAKLDSRTLKMQKALVRSFASFVARGWPSAANMDDRRRVRADTPIAGTEESLLMSSQCQGKVGSQMVAKIEKLTQHLPDSTLRRRAKEVLAFLEAPSEYPVVLNHGDLIPSNILVDPDTGEISGVVDWAEAEYLPFGTCLYGLEHLLGYLDKPHSFAPSFRYYDEAPRLRQVFFSALWELLPELKCDANMEGVLLMRDAGVLLWYGYAWDEGRIDRVVNKEDDKEELECLRAFLMYDEVLA